MSASREPAVINGQETAPATTGIKPDVLIAGGLMPTRPVVAVRRTTTGGGGASRASAPAPVAAAPALPTVEMIRGDKRATEVVNQE